jgi:hypothetical protein
MKTRILTTLSMTLLLLTTSVAAQELSEFANPSDLTVLEKSWRKEYVDSRPRNTNPLQPNEDHMRVTREQKEFIKARDNTLPNQSTEPSMPAPAIKPVSSEREMLTFYIYKIKVQNSGAKRIKNIDWEYQFLDPVTQDPLEQRKLTSRLNLLPGKTKVVEHRLTRKPTQVVRADQLDQKLRDQFTERVVINRIVYTDGTVWQRPVE